MEFFGVGPLELLVILVITLIVVGPQKLPEMAAQLARFLRAFRRYSQQITRDFNEALHDIEQDYQEAKGEWKKVGEGLEDSTREVRSEFEAAGRDARNGLETEEHTPDESARRTSRPG